MIRGLGNKVGAPEGKTAAEHPNESGETFTTAPAVRKQVEAPEGKPSVRTKQAQARNEKER